MRVLIDTNILISALLFPSSVPARALLRAVSEDELVLCDQNIAELREVLRRKAPARLPAAEALLAELSYELNQVKIKRTRSEAGISPHLHR